MPDAKFKFTLTKPTGSFFVLRTTQKNKKNKNKGIVLPSDLDLHSILQQTLLQVSHSIVLTVVAAVIKR